MRGRSQVVLVAALAVGAWSAASNGAAAQEERWHLRFSALGAQSTSGVDTDPVPGFGLGLEYRVTPRIGIELGGLTVEPEAEERINLFIADFTLESSYRITPVLARVNFHFTPEGPVDFYAGPVAGYVDVSDVTLRLRVRGPFGDDSDEVELGADDELAWGAAVGLDVPIGGGRSFVTLGATYLRLPLDVDLAIDNGEEDPQEEFEVLGDPDPLVVHLGYGLRF
jgi:outer membrane protein W